MRRIPLYQKATWFIAATIGLFAYPALSLLVRAASHSLRDGLGIIAQIAGVLFGAVLFAIQVSLGQRSKAALLLTRSHRPYRDYLSEHTEVLLRGWRDYLQEAENGELERPTFPGTGGDPTQPSYREVLEDTAALLMHVFSGKAKSEVRRTLRHLDYSLRQTNAIGARAFRAGHDSQFFFTLIGRAFGVQGIGVYVEEIADALFDRMRTEGVEIAMRQLDASQRVLTGPTLWLCLGSLVLTTVGAILLLLSIPSNSVPPSVRAGAWLVVNAFLLSLVLTLLLVAQLVERVL